MQSTNYSKGKKHAEQIMQKVAYNCKAYKSFLQERQIKLDGLTLNDLPVVDKDNYIKRYDLKDRLYKRKYISDHYLICSSSGSMDEPTLWPRSYKYDLGLENPHTKFLDEHFQITKKKTLIVIAFALGTTQAGMMHLKASWEGSAKGKISVIAPNGNAKTTVFMLDKLHSYYEQVVCIGYPPIISDFIDLAVKRNLKIKKWNLKIAFASESVSALWRKKTAREIGGKLSDIVSFYGTTEAGMIGFETPRVNKIVNLCVENDRLRFDLFGTKNLPTLVKVDFEKKLVEIIDGEIVLTVDQPIPLVRYNVHDIGCLISISEIKKVFNKHNISLKGFHDDDKLLAIYGRNINKTFTIEDIRDAIEHCQHINLLDKEFQFSEKRIGKKTLLIKVICYLSNSRKISTKETNKIKSEIVSFLKNTIKAKNKEIKLSLTIRDNSHKRGYLYGKTRYLI
ncbi:hypothetical protein ACFL1A_00855 [Patescibacteria group bacterium]